MELEIKITEYDSACIETGRYLKLTPEDDKKVELLIGTGAESLIIFVDLNDLRKALDKIAL